MHVYILYSGYTFVVCVYVWRIFFFTSHSLNGDFCWIEVLHFNRSQLLLFCCSAVFDPSWPHGLQHACPSHLLELAQTLVSSIRDIKYQLLTGMDKWINKLRFIHRIKYYTRVRINESELSAAIWVTLTQHWGREAKPKSMYLV